MATSKPKSKARAGKNVKKFITPVFRISFPKLFVASKMDADDDGPPKFSCSAIWNPEKFTTSEKALWSAIFAEMKARSLEVCKKEWKSLASDKRGIRNGSEKDGMEGYGEGTRFANLTSKNRPGVIDKDKNEISSDEGNMDEIYPGCYCRATVNVYAYNNKSKGVALGLRNIQKVKDGPRLDNRTDADEDFDEDIDESWLDGEDDGDGEGDDSGEDDFD